MKAKPKGMARPSPEPLAAPPVDTLVMICSATGWHRVYNDPVGGQVSKALSVWGLFKTADGYHYVRGLEPGFTQVPIAQPKDGDPRMAVDPEVYVTTAPKSIVVPLHDPI